MRFTRRQWLAASAACGAALPQRATAETPLQSSYEQLDRAAARPILRLDGLDKPVKISSVQLLRNGRVFLVRVRTSDGAEGLAVANADRLKDAYPIFLNRVAPYFIGKDARHLETHLWELYRFRSNYKFQGLAFWVCVAAAEFALLDLLGKLTGQSIGDLLGGVKRRNIAVYRASGKRGNTPQDEIEHLRQLVSETGAKAIKFRVGGRMSKNADSLPGRSEALIPLVRDTFGSEMTVYADSNSSYDAANAIRLGRIMQQHDYGFFEEPCRFDHLEETKQVADALTMPVAGGEQEFSMRRFRWMIHHRAVDIVQPDLHYFGGFIRSLRVARMAAEANMPCTVHMSGSGLGYLDMLQFASCVGDPGPFQEFKGEGRIPLDCATSSLRCENGIVRVPSGPGFGITLDPAFVAAARPLTTS